MIKLYFFTTLLFLAATTLFFSCDNAEPKDATNQSVPAEQNYTYRAQSVTETKQDLTVSQEPKQEETKKISSTSRISNKIIKRTVVTDSVGEVKMKNTISDQFIDSLNRIVPLYDTEKYNHLAVSYFTSMADSLNGRAFFAEKSDDVLTSIMEIFSSRVNDGTDIMFLIDKTGSMDDDIETVKNSLNLMMDYLSKFNNVKIGMAFYGDKNYHYDFWYNRTDLTSDIEKVREFMGDYSTIGNPDTQESVNDGIVRTVEETNWTPGSKRVMLVIGDAHSQQPPFSSYSDDQVIKKCEAMNIKFNLYPIVIATTVNARIDNLEKKNFAKVYPNPANHYCNISFSEPGTFMYEVNDMSGRAILRSSSTESKIKVELDDLPDGTYLIQTYNQSLSRYYSTPLIVRH